MIALPLLLVAGLLASSPEPAQKPGASRTLRRFVLVAGANRGADERLALRYALSDAERFIAVMQALGGVDPSDVVMLRQPRVGELDAAFETLRGRVQAARRAGGGTAVRTEVFFYYSGHADEKGVLLGNDRLSYSTLRQQLESVPADVRIGVLDACASGAITRPKGGKLRSPFLVDASSDTRGSAFLASSSAEEAAQESERLGGSFFTHYLLSGMRGAADTSGDGRVTLNEAYQFAFNETLSRTVGTKGGPQHPTHDITMSGTGDVILTDLRQVNAGFVVAAPVDGRFYVLDEKRRLVLEFYKPAGRRVEIGLEAGTYDVRFEREKTARRARVEIKAGAQAQLDPATFGSASVEFTRLRGGYEGNPSDLVNGRYLLGFRFGMWSNPNDQRIQTASSLTDFRASVGSLTAGAHILRYVRDDLAMGIGVHPMLADVNATTGPSGTVSNNRVGVGVPFIVRWSPARRFMGRRAIEPYVSAGFGPLIGTDVTTITTGTPFTDAGLNTTVSGYVETGADVRIASFLVLGVSGGYNWSGRVKNRDGSRTNYSGAEFTFGLGVLLGRTAPRH